MTTRRLATPPRPAVEDMQVDDARKASFLESGLRIDVVSTARAPRTTVVSLVGGHDMSTANAVERRIEDQLGRCDRLVVDLSKVTFVDSGTVRAMLRAALLARSRGVGFEVVSPEESEAGRLLEMLGLMGYYTVREREPSPAPWPR